MQADGVWPAQARPACGAGCGLQPYIPLSGRWYTLSALCCCNVMPHWSFKGLCSPHELKDRNLGSGTIYAMLAVCEGWCTAAGGDSPYAVLDKLVPGYYHRRTEQGDICASCCCNNTATEHLMAERLVIDDITHWARTYKVLCEDNPVRQPTVPCTGCCQFHRTLHCFSSLQNKLLQAVSMHSQVDGFRFDIMGHLMVSTMQKIQGALSALTLNHDGVDGKGLYIYGEAWDFGEVCAPYLCSHQVPAEAGLRSIS